MRKDKPPTLAECIKSLCYAYGVDTSEVARATKVGQTTMSNVIRGNYNPSDDVLKKLAAYFGASYIVLRDLPRKKKRTQKEKK